jgi:predicted metal-binding membrane protein
MNLTTDAALEGTLKRDRLIVMAGLAAIALLAWAFVLAGAGMGMSAFEMTRMEEAGMEAVMSGGEAGAMSGTGGGTMSMMKPVVWTPGYIALTFIMWWIMMIAMMLPTVAPAVLHYAAIHRKKIETGGPYLAVGLFALAYLVIWGGFSLTSVVLQWALDRLGWLSPMLVTTNTLLDEALLLAAGVYQFTPLQRASLSHCRSCSEMMAAEWRDGSGGAFVMGLEHGIKCLGVCWVRMGLLFFAGIMNL